jgi:hypothetical protein
MLRYARYAAVVVFALLAMGFVALWMRSYLWQDSMAGPVGGGKELLCSSSRGVVNVHLFHSGSMPDIQYWSAESVKVAPRISGSRLRNGFLGLGIRTSQGNSNVTLPYWFLAASSLGLAALFAFKRSLRYSLRTILIATTLLAAILGLAIYSL